MPLDLSIKCVKCGKVLEGSEMRALPDGKGFVCRGCYGSGDGLRNVDSPHMHSPPHKLNAEKPFFEKRDFVCDKCKYKFSRNADVHVVKCPYCGSENVHERIEDSADKLLQNDEF